MKIKLRVLAFSPLAGLRRDRRSEALDRFERATEPPLLVLAVAMIPLIFLPLLIDLPSGLHSTFIAADWFI